jgi:uncharacterized membrane protein YeaQ/YmgE (transglycosylase-associated protein family)
MIQLPALVFSLLLASVYGVAFFFWQGRKIGDLLVFWFTAVLGFAAGQWAGNRWDLVPFTIGEIQIVEATLGAALFLAIAKWLRHGVKGA